MKYTSIVVLIIALLFTTASATVWYVHPDSTMNCIQDCLDSCSAGDTVLVGPGIYYENIVWPNTQGIQLISVFGPDTTIIDGDSAGRVMLIGTGVDSTTMINGFTIRNGSSSFGGGISCSIQSSPTISGNKIIWNTATLFGGGIMCNQSSPTISNNIIDSNTAGSWGGGIASMSATSSPYIIGNTITGNTADTLGGGIYCNYSSPIISSNTISNNSVNYDNGGGIFCYYSSPTIIGNIIEFNMANGYYGGGIGCSYSSPIIDSCTISNNNGDGVYCYNGANPEIHYNDIVDNIGYGVRNVDPSIIVNAENNWWGHSTGPYHPATNPGGLGDSVSDYVDYDPWVTGIEEYEPSQSITTFLQINPNPFCDRVNITFNIEHGAKSIELKIYDATGRLVKDFRPTPNVLRSTQISWDGTDQANRQLPSGVYFVKFQAGGYTETKKLLLIK